MSKRLEIKFLGELEVVRGGRPEPLPPSKKTRALLAYLVVSGREHRRERLCQLLWDIADDPRAALRWSLSKLRPVLDDPDRPRILAERATVRADTTHMDVDVHRIRAIARGDLAAQDDETLREAAGLFRGEFLEGLALPDYPDFEAWATAIREESRRDRAAVLRELVRRLEDDPEAAAEYARLWSEGDPLDEAARAHLAGLLLRAGRRREAEQQIEWARKLAAEVRQPLGPALAEIERQLAAARVTHFVPASDPPPEPDGGIAAAAGPPLDPVAIGEIPLVGRSTERAALRAALDRAKAGGRGQVVLLHGEPGVGKSRLIAELAAEVAAERGSVLIGRAHEAESRRPYGPWIDALSSLHPAVVGSTLASRLAPLLPGPGDVAEHDSRERFFASVVELLAARAHSAPPVLLAFDDLHWCDEASAELLSYVLRMTRHRPVLALLAARDGELPDNDPAQRVLRSLRREGILEDLRLDPLTREETAQLLERIAPDADPHRIFADAGGNALLAIELARLDPDRRDRVPPTLAALARDRVERLPPAAAATLNWASVLGGAVSPDTLAGLGFLDAEGLAEALGVLERHGLLRAAPARGRSGPVYTFVHDLLRHAVADDLSEPRRRLMHRRIAETLLPHADNDPALAGELARHAALAGDDALAAEACVRAGRHALRIFAGGDAFAMGRRGAHHAESLPEPDRSRRLLEANEVMLAARRPADPAIEATRLEELAERALELGAVEHARLGFHLVSYLRWERGEWQEARSQMLRARDVAHAGDERERTLAMAEAARCLALLGRDLPDAEAMALEARSRARQAGVDPPAVPDTLGMLAFHRGDWETAAAHFRRARDLSLRDGDRLGEFQALERLIMLELERGRLDEADALLPALGSIAGKVREGSELPAANALRELTARLRGVGSAPDLDAALEALRRVDAKQRLAYVLNRTARRLLDDAEPGPALRYAEEARAVAGALGHRSESAFARALIVRAADALGDRAAREAARAELREFPMEELAAPVRTEVETALGPMRN